jgi:hypothetical protein
VEAGREVKALQKEKGCWEKEVRGLQGQVSRAAPRTALVCVPHTVDASSSCINGASPSAAAVVRSPIPPPPLPLLPTRAGGAPQAGSRGGRGCSSGARGGAQGAGQGGGQCQRRQVGAHSCLHFLSFANVPCC